MDTRKNTYKPRIRLNEEIVNNFFKNIFKETVSGFARSTGLPYNLVYNLVHGRVKSLSAKAYRIIFGEKPPFQEAERVDGRYFRNMVGLWLFLNGDVTKKALYAELYRDKRYKKADFRIFSGKTNTVEIGLEEAMEQKFIDQGLDRAEIKKWIKEFDHDRVGERVSYEEAKPVLSYLQQILEITPSRILNQGVGRYRSGRLKTISDKKYDYALHLKERTEKAVRNGSRLELEMLRDEVCGRKNGPQHFLQIEEELEFLQKHARTSARKYLGRSIATYKKSKLKRIASWRAEKIKKDCEELIEQRPEIPLASIPRSVSKMKISQLLTVVRGLLVAKMIEDENRTYERLVLDPSYSKIKEYRTYGSLIRIDNAASELGMGKKAFDLMVAAHSDIFRKIAIYNKRWYLPDLYIKELKEKEGFFAVKAKYELLKKANRCGAGSPAG